VSWFARHTITSFHLPQPVIPYLTEPVPNLIRENPGFLFQFLKNYHMCRCLSNKLYQSLRGRIDRSNLITSSKRALQSQRRDCHAKFILSHALRFFRLGGSSEDDAPLRLVLSQEILRLRLRIT
jgi:hypothetical protein